MNLTSTVIGSIATYQCKNGLSKVYTTQCTSDGVWEPNPNSTLDCTPPGIITGLMFTSSQASCVFQCVYIMLYFVILLWGVYVSYYLIIISVLCKTLQSTESIIVNFASTAMGSNATYQCRDGSSDVYTTQCTSDGVWEPNPNSTLNCTMTDYGVPMNGVIVAVIILVIVTVITIVVIAVLYWRINKTSEPQHDLVPKVLFFLLT